MCALVRTAGPRHEPRKGTALPRKRDIEAAVAAHNATDGPKQTLLPPEAARLLAVMFSPVSRLPTNGREHQIKKLTCPCSHQRLT
jgi:hypothetical protein